MAGVQTELRLKLKKELFPLQSFTHIIFQLYSSVSSTFYSSGVPNELHTLFFPVMNCHICVLNNLIYRIPVMRVNRKSHAE
ncbi:hypothetical protein D3C77_423970 [compost metagenome]